MRGEPVFLGVYVKASDSGSGSGAANARRWHAWGLADGSFLVREAPQENAKGKKPDAPEDSAQHLSVDEFFTGFRVFAAFSAKHKPSFPRGQADDAAPEPAPESAASRPGSAAEKAAAPRKKTGTAPTGAEQGLLRDLTRGVGEDHGKDYVLVKGDRRKEASAYHARAVIQFDDDGRGSGPPAAAVSMDKEEIARIEQSFRTDFSLSLIKLKSKRDDALKNLEKLAKSRGPFAREHKFMFTDCGLALRKRNMFVLAQQFHEKAMVLSPDDEHVLFNLARVMYECGKTEQAKEYLAKSVAMAPDFQAGRDFLSFLDGGRPAGR